MSPEVTLLVEGTYPTELGGVGVWMERLVVGLPEVRFRLVRIGQPLPPRSAWPLRAPPNLKDALSVAPPQLPTESLDDWADRAAARVGRRALVHVVGAGLAARLALVLRRRHGTPYLLTEHASYADEIAQGAHTLECGLRLETLTGNRWTREEAVRLFRAIAREAYRAAAGVTALYEAFRQRQTAAGAPADRCWVVPNGVPLPSPEPTVLPPHGRRPLTVGFVGRLDQNKRPALFAEAAREALRQGAPIRPVLVAAHSIPEALRPRLEGISLYAATPPEIWPHLLDLLVVTSRHESQPLVVLEAMAAGVPVVAPLVGGCPELVLGRGGRDLGAAGLLVPAGSDARPFAQAIFRLSTTRRLWHDASAAGRRRVRHRYRLDQMLAAYRRLYDHVAGGSRAREDRNHGPSEGPGTLRARRRHPTGFTPIRRPEAAPR